MKAFASVLLLLSLLFAGVVNSVFVHKDVSRMGEYEMIEFEIDDGLSSISFIAFGNLYELSLKLNENIIGTNILDHHGIHGESNELKKSCHYHVEFAG